MAPRRIRMGVSGLGRVGWPFHCKEIASHAAFELAAVQDPLPERRAEAERVYGCRSYELFDDMLRNERLDAVAIASPTHLHRGMSEAAFRAGCHVMLEKPMAPDSTDAAGIVRSARRRARILTVYQPARAAAYFQQLRKLVLSGAIGEPYHFRIGMYQFTIRNDWQALRRFGGGMLNNYGAHGLDQLLQLMGHDLRRVWCSLRLVASLGDAEDVVKITLESRSGVLGELDINQASTINPYTLDAWGSRGSISLSGDRAKFTVRSFAVSAARGRRLVPELASANRRYPDGDVPMVERSVAVESSLGVDVYADFAKAVRTGRPAFVRPEEPLEVMRLIDRCREDAGRIRRTSVFPRMGSGKSSPDMR